MQGDEQGRGTRSGLDPQKGPLSFRGQIIIESAETLTELREKGRQLYEARVAMHELNKFDLESRQNRMKAIEMELMADISAEVDENGKAVYSNKDKRQAELVARLDTHEEYKELQQEIREFREKQTEVAFDLEMAKHEYYQVISEKDILCGMANLS